MQATYTGIAVEDTPRQDTTVVNTDQLYTFVVVQESIDKHPKVISSTAGVTDLDEELLKEVSKTNYEKYKKPLNIKKKNV